MLVNQNSLEGIEGLLIFNIGGKEFCTDTINLNAIIKVDESKFSNENHSKGELFYEGQFFKIIDIKEILKIPMLEFSSRNRIILFESSDNMFGFIADEIIEIITTDSIFQNKYLKLIPTAESGYICGELLFQKRNISLLNMGRIGKELKTIKKYN